MDSDTKQGHRGLALGCNDFHRICLAYDTAGYFKDSQLPFNGALMVLNSGYLGRVVGGYFHVKLYGISGSRVGCVVELIWKGGKGSG